MTLYKTTDETYKCKGRSKGLFNMCLVDRLANNGTQSLILLWSAAVLYFTGEVCVRFQYYVAMVQILEATLIFIPLKGCRIKTKIL